MVFSSTTTKKNATSGNICVDRQRRELPQYAGKAAGAPRRSMGHENGDCHARKQGPTGAIKNHLPQSRVAVEAHDDEVDVVIRRSRAIRITGKSTW